jgi:NitT/TauT family transport system substrate-binding protein
MNKNDQMNDEAAKKTVTRREFLCASAAMGASALLAGQSILPVSAQAAEKKVKSCYLPIADATPIILAHELGYYKEQGLASDRPMLIRGWPAMAKTFTEKKVNLTHLLMPMAIQLRYGQNFPLKVVAWDHTNGSALTVGKKSGIQTYADLAGKRIAVPYWYSMHNVIIQMIASKLGLEPVIQAKSAKPTAKQLGLFMMNPPDMPPAMAGGEIDGYIVAEPFNALGELNAGGRIVRFTGDVWKNHPCCVAVMHEEDLKEDREWSHKVIAALVKAELWALQNREEAAKIMSKDGAGYLPFPEPVIKQAMTKYDIETYGEKGTGAIRHPDWNGSRIAFQPYQMEAATVRLIEELKKTKIDDKTDFLQKLKGEAVHKELMYTDGVKEAVEKMGGLAQFPGVEKDNPYTGKVIIEV